MSVKKSRAWYQPKLSRVPTIPAETVSSQENVDTKRCPQAGRCPGRQVPPAHQAPGRHTSIFGKPVRILDFSHSRGSDEH